MATFDKCCDIATIKQFHKGFKMKTITKKQTLSMIAEMCKPFTSRGMKIVKDTLVVDCKGLNSDAVVSLLNPISKAVTIINMDHITKIQSIESINAPLVTIVLY